MIRKSFLPEMLSMKPRMRFHDGKWICRTYFFSVTGPTQELAYRRWQHKLNSVEVQNYPRQGMWNKKGVRQWYWRGCPLVTSRVFIKTGHCSNLETDSWFVVGYDYPKDELILARFKEMNFYDYPA